MSTVARRARGLICALGGVALGMILMSGLTVRAAKPTDAAQAEKVELFAAVKAKDVSVNFVPTDSTKGHLQVTNTSGRVLSVELPKTFAGAPVLAQFQPPPFGGQQNNRNQQNAQLLGSTPGNGQNGQNGQNNRQVPFFMMNIPPGKTQEVPLTCVCLEYGKPTPSSDMSYKAVTLDSVTKSAEVEMVLDELADGKIDQRVAQILAWHFNNKMSFSELTNEGLGMKRINAAKPIAERIKAAVAAKATPSPGDRAASAKP